MSYFMLPIETLDELERAGISRDARLLFVESVCYSASNLTDGLIRRWGKVSDAADPELLAQELVTFGIMTEVEGGFAITDYKRLQNGWDAERIHSARAQSRERQQRWRDKQRIPAESRNALRNASLTASVTGTGQDGTGPDRRDGTGPDGPVSAVDAHGVPRAALHAEASPHIFVDKDYLGVCRFCGKSDKQGPHQRGLPPTGMEVAAQLAKLGIPAQMEKKWDDEWRVIANHELGEFVASIHPQRNICVGLLIEVNGIPHSEERYNRIAADLEAAFPGDRWTREIEWQGGQPGEPGGPVAIWVDSSSWSMEDKVQDLLRIAAKHRVEAATT